MDDRCARTTALRARKSAIARTIEDTGILIGDKNSAVSSIVLDP
jgi:hypothetical protein